MKPSCISEAAYDLGIEFEDDEPGELAWGGVDTRASRKPERESIMKLEQAKAVASGRLPFEGLDSDAGYQALGIRCLEKVDDLFCKASLPDGWKVNPTGHSMHNVIVDERGRERGSYFYKGAFYGRRARIHAPKCRFVATRDYDVPTGSVEIVLMDGGLTVHRFGRVDIKADEHSWDVADREMVKARAWLSARLPDCDNVLAYWDLLDWDALPSFPEGYTFTVEDGTVIAADAHGEPVDLACDSPELADVRAWASLLAGQPANPYTK